MQGGYNPWRGASRCPLTQRICNRATIAPSDCRYVGRGSARPTIDQSLQRVCPDLVPRWGALFHGAIRIGNACSSHPATFFCACRSQRCPLRPGSTPASTIASFPLTRGTLLTPPLSEPELLGHPSHCAGSASAPRAARPLCSLCGYDWAPLRSGVLEHFEHNHVWDSFLGAKAEGVPGVDVQQRVVTVAHRDID